MFRLPRPKELREFSARSLFNYAPFWFYALVKSKCTRELYESNAYSALLLATIKKAPQCPYVTKEALLHSTRTK